MAKNAKETKEGRGALYSLENPSSSLGSVKLAQKLPLQDYLSASILTNNLPFIKKETK